MNTNTLVSLFVVRRIRQHRLNRFLSFMFHFSAVFLPFFTVFAVFHRQHCSPRNRATRSAIQFFHAPAKT